MKIAALFAATAYAGLSDMDEERKFTDKPAWMSADLGWENYFNRPANYRINELACRIDPFFQKFFPGNGMENQFEGVLRSIKRSFEKCHGELMTSPPDCKWMDWLDGDTETVSHRVMVVYGVAVREFIYKSDEKRACQSYGLRLVSGSIFYFMLTFEFSSND